MKTLFIENDSVFNQEEMDTHSKLHEREFNFDLIITDAFSNTKEAFEAILNADEVYVSTAFIGDSAQVFDALAYHLLNKKVKGKKLFVFRPVERLHLWNLHRPENFRKLFKSNELYCEVQNGSKTEFELVNAKNII